MSSYYPLSDISLKWSTRTRNRLILNSFWTAKYWNSFFYRPAVSWNKLIKTKDDLSLPVPERALIRIEPCDFVVLILIH